MFFIQKAESSKETVQKKVPVSSPSSSSSSAFNLSENNTCNNDDKYIGKNNDDNKHSNSRSHPNINISKRVNKEHCNSNYFPEKDCSSACDLLCMELLNRRYVIRRKLEILGAMTLATNLFVIFYFCFLCVWNYRPNDQLASNDSAYNAASNKTWPASAILTVMMDKSEPLLLKHLFLMPNVILLTLSTIMAFLSLCLLCPLVNGQLTNNICDSYSIKEHPKQKEPDSCSTIPLEEKILCANTNSDNNNNNINSNDNVDDESGPSNKNFMIKKLLRRNRKLSNNYAGMKQVLFNSMFLLFWLCSIVIVYNVLYKILNKEMIQQLSAEEINNYNQTQQSNQEYFRSMWIKEKEWAKLPRYYNQYEWMDVHLLTAIFALIYCQSALPFSTFINVLLQLICFFIYICWQLMQMLNERKLTFHDNADDDFLINGTETFANSHSININNYDTNHYLNQQEFYYYSSSSLSQYQIRKLISDTLILIVFILYTKTWKHRLEKENCDTFSGAQKIIDDRIQLEFEREHQEQLLLSVIPAYIAAEVKRRIMLKMNNEMKGGGTKSNDSNANSTSKSIAGGANSVSNSANFYRRESMANASSHCKLGPCDLLPKTPQKQRFHELYVQRHNNVR